MTDRQYNPALIEAQARAWWEEHQSFRVTEDPEREKFYCLCMFPYPSGQLHMGHVRNYTIGDVIARYQRMLGKNVLQPMGWDAFGLPAEGAAIKHGMPPARWTRENIGYMREQFKQLGFGYDWSRELVTCDPDYYRWEQWMFTRLMQKGIAYKKKAVVNWDPVDQTVLANEQVIDGRGWRSGALIERREIPQWFLRITRYAEELLENIDSLDWPESVKLMQRNWIGRSEGVEVDFAIEGGDDKLCIYTTRPDTLMGVSYMAVAAEHPLAVQAAERSPELAAFLKECQQSAVSEAAMEVMEKRGMSLGINVIHPITGEAVPVWVANFVLMTYGTGAVMSVPGHDQRDWEFARQFGLPILQVIAPADESQACDMERAAFVEHGVLVDSDDFTGMSFAEAFDAIAATLESSGKGRRKVNYRLRDWLVSRQRYWGAPIPVINSKQGSKESVQIPVPDQDLPVILPEDVDFQDTGSPIKSMPSFYETVDPVTGDKATRETDTFDTFMESSWYYSRFACPGNDEAMVDERANYWLPVDLYIGGIEHAILHLLYARFYHKLMRDEGLVSSDEPFRKLLTQGMVLKDGAKMSKSRGNTVDPQGLIETYGADTVRLFVMFAAPPEQSLEWSDEGVKGAFRFLRKLWRTVHAHASQSMGPADAVQIETPDDRHKVMRRALHQTISKVSDDVGRRYTFNTAIAAIMELMNTLAKFEIRNAGDLCVARETLEKVVLMLSPIVPHICHHLWQILGHDTAVVDESWPTADPTAMVADTLNIVIQVNGKLRARIEVPADITEDVLKKTALANDNVQRFTTDREIRKIIVVPGKLVSIVV